MIHKDTSHICLKCLKSFKDYPSNKRKYCSKSCSNSVGMVGNKRALGYKHTQEVKDMLAERLKGEKCPWWKGGITPINRKIRNSKMYQEWRKAVFERDDYTCQVCNERGGVLNADHIKSFSEHPELRLNINNGRTLCLECHKETDNYFYKSSKTYEKRHRKRVEAGTDNEL